jgi:hypothetical protein
MTILFIIGITLLALFALSLLARRFEKAANGLRWLARPFSIIGWACLHGSIACQKQLENALEWPPKANVIARVVYLVVALFVFAGDFALARLRSAAFFGVIAGKLAWLPLDTFSGLLWLCVSALWGIVLLDLIDLIPPGWRLLPVERLSKIVRLIATLLALVLFVVSALTMAYFVLWGQMQISEQVASSADTAVLGFNISLAFGLLLGLASAIALWALFVGIAGVYTIFVALSYVVLRILALGLGIFGHSLATAGEEYLKPVPFPLFHYTPATASLPSRGAVAGFLPEASGSQLPDTTPEEDSMTDKVVTRIHLDNIGFRFAPPLDRAGEEVGAQRIVRLQAVADLSRPKGCTMRPSSQSISDITPHGQINDIIQAGIPLEQAYARIMHTIVESIVDSFTNVPVSKGHIVLTTDPLLVPYLAEELQNLHRRLPFHTIILVSTLSEHVLADRRWDEAVESLRVLWEEEVILNTLVIDERSALAKRAGEETQERFLAKFLASLLVCHEHSYFNPSFGQVFERCSAASPFTTLSFASAKVSSGKATPGQHLVNAFRSKAQAKVGKGDVNDCINQTVNLFQRVCEPRSLAMIEEGVTIGDPLFFLVNEPIPLSDQRFAEYRNAIQPVMTQTNPQAKLIVVRGSGTAETKDNPGYYIQATALRPLLLTPPEAAHEVAQMPLAAEIVQPETAPVHVNGRRRQQSTVA